MAIESVPSLSVITTGAGIGYSERRALDLVGNQLFAAGALPQVGNTALQPEEIFLFGVFQDRNNQTPVESNRDADVYMLMVADAVILGGRIDDGELLQTDYRGPHKKRHERQS